MKRKKIHIDELFRDGLKNLSLFVSSKDMEAIDDKKSVFNEPLSDPKSTVFTDFELEVSDNDWMAVKSKLDIEKAAMAQDNIFSRGLSNLELDVDPLDWTGTYQKYKNRKRKNTLFRWLGTGLILLLIGISSVFVYLNKNSKAESVTIQQAAVSDKQQSVGDMKKENHVQRDTKAQDETHQLSAADPVKPVQTENMNFGKEQHQTLSKDQSGKTSNDKTSKSKKSNLMAFVENRQTSNPSDPVSPVSAIETKEQTPVQNFEKKTVEPVVTENQKKEIQDKSDLEKENTDQPSDLKTDEGKKETAMNSPVQISSDSTIQKQETQKPLQTPPVPPVKINISGKTTGLYFATVNQLLSTYRSLGSENHPKYNQIRNAGEKPMWQFTKGFEFGIQKKNFQLSSGVQHTSQSWTTHYKYNYRVFDSLPVWNPGRTQIVGYLLVRGRDTSINQTQVIKIQKVQIPLEYKQIIKINDKVNFMAGVGMLMSWNTKTSGSKMLNPVNMQLYHYSVLENMERKFNFSPSIDLGIQNVLYRNFRLQTSLYGNRAIYSRFRDEYNVKDYAYSFGINIKLIYMIK